MAKLIDYIVILNSLFEILGAVIISEAVILKSPPKNRVAGGIFCFIITGCIIILNILGFSRLLLLAVFLFIVCFIKLRYKTGMYNAFLYALFCIIYVKFIELLIYIPFNILSALYPGNSDISLLVAIIMVLACYIVKKKGFLIWTGNWVNKKEQIFYMFLVVLCIFLTLFMDILKPDGETLWKSLYLAVVFFLYIGMAYKLSMYSAGIEIYKEYLDKYNDAVVAIQARQHKFMNQINAIYLLFEIYDNYEDLVAKQKEEIKNLKQYIMPDTIMVLGRPLVIAHIYKKMCEAEDMGIVMQTQFSCSIKDINIPDIYLIEVIGNLIDNAMEETIKRNLNEHIFLSISMDLEEICIHVCNEHSRIPYSIYNKFFEQGFSTKGDGRGAGLPYVKRIVNRYGGRIEIGNTVSGGKNRFSVFIYFK